MKECSPDANIGLSCYVIERKNFVGSAGRICGVELSKGRLKAGSSSLENVAGATSVYCPLST